jgi:hypothetical protein
MTLFLTEAAVLQCAHGGRVQVTARDRRTTAGGSPLLCEPDLEGAPITGCAQPASTSTKPCTTLVKTMPVSSSQRITAGGRNVYLATLTGLTDGVPPAPVTVTSAGQTSTRLEGAP